MRGWPPIPRRSPIPTMCPAPSLTHPSTVEPLRPRIGLRDLRSLQPDQTIWDGSVSGFGARRQGGTVVSYIVVYRTREGRQRTYTIGKHGSPWSPDTARQEARRVLGEVVKGADPLAEKTAGRKAITVADLCRQYLGDVESGRLLTRRKVAKKESTLVSDRGRIARHIIPLIGRKSVTAITRNDIDQFMHDVAAGKTAISRAESGFKASPSVSGSSTRIIGR
jgi:Arm DNA-binding domain